ncbi:hypothetical protein [Ethanoligenens sp.]|uniref:hypothetical protein n=1 Tax=Ethanoligenens sp. TaxID=2099655 RepID=UPI0039E80D0B
MTYDFSIWPDAIVSRARAKRRNILRRFGDSHSIVSSNAYLWELCEEEAEAQIASAVFCGKPILQSVIGGAG